MPPTSPVVVPINADEFVTSVDAIHDDSPRGRISSIEGAKRLAASWPTISSAALTM